MMQEEDFWKNEISASGIVQQDSSIMDLIGTKGNVATIPIYKPLNVHDENMGALNNDGMTNNTPVEISGDKQTCMLIQRMKAFKAKDFTKELTGADPLGLIKNKIADYYKQVWEMELMNIANAVLGVTELADHITDLSVTSGTIAAANNIDETTMIDAEQKALGDMAGGLGLVIMHSKIFARYKKLGLVEYGKYTIGNAIRQDIELPTINGKEYANGVRSKTSEVNAAGAEIGQAGVDGINSVDYATPGGNKGATYASNFVEKAKSIINNFINSESYNSGGSSVADLVSSVKSGNIPKYASGGIVDRATIAQIGEDGPEAVVPLKNNTEWIDLVANKVAKAMGRDSGGTVVNYIFENVNMNSDSDIEEAAYKFEAMRQKAALAMGGD